MFSVLREKFGELTWQRMARESSRSETPRPLSKLPAKSCSKNSTSERFLQFAFFEQWGALRSYCAARGIRIIGDVVHLRQL